MSNRVRARAILVSGILLAFLVSVAAQQAAPTAKDPIRFRAIMQTQGQDAGAQGVANIVIERWSTDAERKSLVDLLAERR